MNAKNLKTIKNQFILLFAIIGGLAALFIFIDGLVINRNNLIFPSLLVLGVTIFVVCLIMLPNTVVNKNLKVFAVLIMVLSVLEIIYFLNFNTINHPYSPRCYKNNHFLVNKPLMLGATTLSVILFGFVLVIKTNLIKAIISFELLVFSFKTIFLKSYYDSCVILGWGLTDFYSYYMDIAGLLVRAIIIYLIFFNKKYIIYFLSLYVIITYLLISNNLYYWFWFGID